MIAGAPVVMATTDCEIIGEFGFKAKMHSIAPKMISGTSIARPAEFTNMYRKMIFPRSDPSPE